MFKKSVFLLLIFFSAPVFAEKYGIIVAIGAYLPKTGWSTISSVNDVPLIKQSLLSQGFEEKNITTLIDAEATKLGIITALEKLTAKIKPGDIVVFHYSGHGQQIFDDNGDEVDGKDEALVPYDAWVRYTFNYKGENHLRDDELGTILANFRNKLGKTGQLMVVLDSCHSGSSTRGRKSRGGEATFAPENWQPLAQDKTKGSAMMERVKIAPDAAPFVLITGASADELNYEYEGFGSLSYALSKAMTELGTHFTYRQLFSKIASTMNVISPRQTPTIEGDVDYLIFNGNYVQQQPYYEISKLPNPNFIHMNAGKIQGVFEGTTVKIIPSGSAKATDKNVKATGIVTQSNFNVAYIKLDQPLTTLNPKDYWVVIDKLAYGDRAIKVFFDPKIKDTAFKNGIAKYLNDNKLGNEVAAIDQADVVLEQYKDLIVLKLPNGLKNFGNDDQIRGGKTIEEVTQALFQFAQGQYLKNLSLKNQAYEIEIKLLPVQYDEATGKVGELIGPVATENGSGILEVIPGKDYAVLQVTNKSKKTLYFSLIEINSVGEIAPFMPNDQCPLTNEERKLAPGQTMVFRDCIYSFGPPYETLIIKAFSTTTPLNFQPTISTRGAETRSANPLEHFLQKSYSLSRGSTGNSATNSDVDGFCTEFVYKIVKQ